MNRSASITLALTLIVISVGFLSVVNFDFVNFDDDLFLLNNLDIRKLDAAHIKAMFTHTINYTYVPLTSLTFALEYHFFEFNPFIYHLDNLLLHIIGCAMLFLLCLRLGLSPLAASIAACLFGLHPLRVDSVAWVSERKDVLCGLFYLLALNHYCLYCQFKKKGYLFATLLWGVLSILAKPVSIHLFAVLFLFDWYLKRPLSVKLLLEKLLLYLPMAIIVQFTFIGHPNVHGLRGFFDVSTLMERALMIIWALMFYIRQFVFPHTLVMFNKLPVPVTIGNPQYLIPLIVFVLLLVCLTLFRKNRLMIFAFVFYLLTIFILVIFPNTDDAQYIVNRYMYLPSIGFCIFLGQSYINILEGFKSKPIFKTVFHITGAALLIVLSLKTVAQAQTWKNSVNFWEYQLRENPSAVTGVLYTQLGAAYLLEVRGTKDSDTLNKVIQLEKRALEINPNLISAYYHIGDAYLMLGNKSKAVENYRKPLSIRPEDPKSYLRLGSFYLDIDRQMDALKIFNKALGLKDARKETYAYILREYERALDNNPALSIIESAKTNLIHEFEKRYQDNLSSRAIW